MEDGKLGRKVTFDGRLAMQRALLAAAIATSLAVSTVLIICSIDRLAVCGPAVDTPLQFFIYKDYCVLPYVTRSPLEDNMEIFDRITLALHISSDYLDDKIIEQANGWDGPITLTVVTPSKSVFKNIRDVQEKLTALPEEVLRKVSAHLVFHSKSGCSIRDVRELDQPPRQYPANVARNVARMFVRSKFVLLGDYEFIFSEGFESRMRALAADELARNPKTALVFRIFELNDSVESVPRDKVTLQSLYSKRLAVEFHAMFTRNAHKMPRLTEWFKHPEDIDKASIASVLRFSRREWEPQFVSLNTIPLHDENFPYSLRDNTVLRWEMCRMNYTFALVNDVFMVHRGIKTFKDIPATKALQRRARPQFLLAMRLFTARMNRAFPETSAVCPKFGA